MPLVSRKSSAAVLVSVKFSDAFPLANLLGERSEQFHAASHDWPGISGKCRDNAEFADAFSLADTLGQNGPHNSAPRRMVSEASIAEVHGENCRFSQADGSIRLCYSFSRRCAAGHATRRRIVSNAAPNEQ